MTIEINGAHLLDDPIAWGHRLIETKDVDPVYDVLVQSLLPADQLKRWLLAYWCLYHVGAASKISELQGRDYWELLMEAADNVEPIEINGSYVRWPRSPERRHWRGAASIKCARWLVSNFTYPEAAVGSLAPLPCHEGHYTYQTIVERVQKWPSFGPWIGFKVADMIERVLGIEVRFPLDVAFFDAPRLGLEMASPQGKESQIDFLKNMIASYSLLAPPGRPNRLCNVQEAETVLCKWKSARGGHYYIGKDTHELPKSLSGWGETADRLAAHVPKGNT